MNRLTPEQVIEYFDDHLPDRLGVLLAHYRMTRTSWTGDLHQLRACYTASLVTARMFLNLLGIGKDGSALGVHCSKSPTDVMADDLGGVAVNIDTLAPNEKDMLYRFIKMADQAAAHFTVPIVHNWHQTHEVRKLSSSGVIGYARGEAQRR